MGLMDKVKGWARKADDGADLARQHADKLPDGVGDKVTDIANTVDEATDKIPGSEK